MKKVRKVSAYILVLMLVFSTFSMPYAEEQPAYLTDVAGSANAQAITVCNYLNIVNGNPDGTYLPDRSVTRAEFAAMLTRALAVPESALQGFGSSKFKDTTGYGWAVPYLAFCDSKGIMLGDGKGNAMPGKTITLNEAITMALRAVGYTPNSSMLTGAWPANYISIAQNNDLYEDVAAGDTVNRANAAQIIYNTLFVQKVAVSSNGETVPQKDSAGEASTMLSTGLGCTMEEGLVDLGTYSDSLINLVPYVGAYGEIYLNKDDKVVAVNPTSATLFGNVSADATRLDLPDGTHFNLDDAEYTSPNSVYIVNTAEQYTITSCAAFATLPVTINAEIKGDDISKVYSVVYWVVDDFFEVDSGIMDEIKDDKTINGWKLPLTDEDELDYSQLSVYGTPSLADLKEEDNIYIYKNYNSGDEVNYIEVGTGKISGEVQEFDDGGEYVDVYVINDQPIQAYKGGPYMEAGCSYDISLDAWGFVYDFDKTSGSTDTYGVVKASETADAFNNMKIKLYTSDRSTKTLYLAEDNPADIDWTDAGSTLVSYSAVSAGALIGYSVDSNGDIDAINNSMAAFTSGDTFKSAKVVAGLTIDPDCAVFTYPGTNTADTANYDSATLADIDAGTVIADGTHPAWYVLNHDGDVAAMFLSDAFADASNDAVYGVFNTRSTTTTDGEKVYKFTGFIDGTTFSYKTDDTANAGRADSFDHLAGVFGVYAVTLDSSNQITKVEDLTTAYNPAHTSGIVVQGTVSALGSDNTVFTVGSSKYVAADNAVVYKFDDSSDEYTVSKLSAIKKLDNVMLYDTKGSDADGIATVVIYIAH